MAFPQRAVGFVFLLFTLYAVKMKKSGTAHLQISSGRFSLLKGFERLERCALLLKNLVNVILDGQDDSHVYEYRGQVEEYRGMEIQV